MSRTMGSPAWMTRSDASWWDDAEFGPERDDREQSHVMPLGDEPFADLAGDVGLGATDEPAGRDRRHDAIGRVRGLAEQGDLVGVLDHPEIAQDRGRGLEAGGRPEMRLEPEEMGGPQAVRHRDPWSAVAGRRRDAAGDDRVRIVELAPGHDLDRRPQAGLRGAALEARDDDERRLAGDDREHREALERHGLVAGQVPQVGPDADQQRIEPARRGGIDGPTQPLGVPRVRDDRSSRDRRHEAAVTVATRSIQALIVAGPSSASFR